MGGVSMDLSGGSGSAGSPEAEMLRAYLMCVDLRVREFGS